MPCLYLYLFIAVSCTVVGPIHITVLRWYNVRALLVPQDTFEFSSENIVVLQYSIQ